MLRIRLGFPYWNNELFFDYPVWGYEWWVSVFRIFGVSEMGKPATGGPGFASSVCVSCFGSAPDHRWADEASGQRWRRPGLLAAFGPLLVWWVGAAARADMFSWRAR